MIKTRMWVFFLAAILSGCGGSSGEPPANPEPSEDDPEVIARSDLRDIDQLYAYDSDSPYAAVLKDCALIDDSDDACTLETLPFITQASPDFTIEDVMDRLLVTHDWMGERFETMLRGAPSNLIPLFGSLTSIAIGSTIRPSSYWMGTGGIQLDPATFWLSVEEKENISIDADYRNDYGKDLQFWEMLSLQDNEGSAVKYFSLSDSKERTLRDITIPVYRLLYHELSHAVDYLPGASVATLDTSLVPARALFENSQYFLSPQMNLDLPLYSQALYDLGQVSFRGETATEAQKNFTPSDVGSEMSVDGAVEYYGYSTGREDLSTLFTAVMMKIEYGIDYFNAFVQKPQDESQISCRELVVGWGVKNRLADPLVAARAKWVVESIYGSNARIDDFFANQLGKAVPMTAGLDWCTNRDSVSTIALSQKSGTDAFGTSTSSQRQLLGERRTYTH